MKPAELAAVAALRRLDVPDPKPGEYDVHGILHIKIDARVRKAPPTVANAPVKPNSAQLLAAVLKAAGVKQPKIEAIIAKAMKLALDPVRIADWIADTKAALEVAEGKLPQGEPREKEGQCRVEGECDVIAFLPSGGSLAKVG